MLYVSRVLKNWNIGVVDTDDMVEEFVTWQKMHRLISSGIAIRGVSGVGSGEMAFPYQGPARNRAALAKLSLVTGVELIVYKDTLVGVDIHATHFQPGVSIRLSDYVTAVADNVVGTDAVEEYGGSITFVIDDKVKMSDLLLYNHFCLDLREFSNDKMIFDTYQGILERHELSLSRFSEVFIDRFERTEYYLRMLTLTASEDISSELETAFKNSPRHVEYSTLVCDAVLEAAESIHKSLRVDVMYLKGQTLRSFIYGWCIEPDWGILSDSKDFERLRGSCDILAIAVFTSTLNTVELYALRATVKYFHCTDKIKSLYVKICNELAKQMKEALICST